MFIAALAQFGHSWRGTNAGTVHHEWEVIHVARPLLNGPRRYSNTFLDYKLCSVDSLTRHASISWCVRLTAEYPHFKHNEKWYASCWNNTYRHSIQTHCERVRMQSEHALSIGMAFGHKYSLWFILFVILMVFVSFNLPIVCICLEMSLYPCSGPHSGCGVPHIQCGDEIEKYKWPTKATKHAHQRKQ